MSSESLVEDCQNLINACKTLTLATASEDVSHCSYAPYVWIGHKAYILVSDLAEHTRQLKDAPKKIGCMLIADEADSPQIFARRRLMFKSTPVQIERDSRQWSELIDTFKQRFGDIVDLLESLPDFKIFELAPERAVLVKGFGDAHKLSDEIFNQTN